VKKPPGSCLLQTRFHFFTLVDTVSIKPSDFPFPTYPGFSISKRIAVTTNPTMSKVAHFIMEPFGPHAPRAL